MDTRQGSTSRGTLRASSEVLVHAPKARVMAALLEYRDWPRFFPTIAAVRLLGEEDGRVRLELDHQEGKVVNLIEVVSPDEVRIEEQKRKYVAVFLYRFEDVAGGTRLIVNGEARLRGLLRLIAPLLRPYMRRQIYRYVLQPMKSYAESDIDTGVGPHG